MLDCMSWTKLRRVEHRTTPTTLRRLIKVIQCQVCPSLQQHTKRPVVISTFRAFALRPVSYGRRAIARNVKLPPVSRVLLNGRIYLTLSWTESDPGTMHWQCHLHCPRPIPPQPPPPPPLHLTRAPWLPSCRVNTYTTSDFVKSSISIIIVFLAWAYLYFSSL